MSNWRLVFSELKIGQDKRTVGILFQIKDFDDSRQINGTINVWKRIPIGDAGGWGPARWRLPFQVRGKKRGFDGEQDESTLSFVEILSNRQNLRMSRAMDKSFGRQAFRAVDAVLLCFIPRPGGGYMEDQDCSFEMEMSP